MGKNFWFYRYWLQRLERLESTGRLTAKDKSHRLGLLQYYAEEKSRANFQSC
jgi:hypothetical protein